LETSIEKGKSEKYAHILCHAIQLCLDSNEIDITSQLIDRLPKLFEQFKILPLQFLISFTELFLKELNETLSLRSLENFPTVFILFYYLLFL